MYRRTNVASDDSVFIDIDTAARLTQLGKNTIRRLAQESNSARKIGKSYRINRAKLLDYIDTFEM
nr:DUF6462 family protein [uncultured Acetatifactor sp.]